MGNEFEGKVAVVTGSSGIGLGAAQKLAHEGAVHRSQVFCAKGGERSFAAGAK